MNNAINAIDEARDMITSFKLGILKTPELCDEIITKAKEYLVSEQKYKEYLDFSARFYKYSFNNTMLIKMQNPNATYVGSYKHLQGLGYHVRKGQHGYTILVPVVVKTFVRDGKPVRLKDATPDEKFKIACGELSLNERTYFKPGTVFDIAQTDIKEDDLPEFLKGMRNKKHSAKQYGMLREFVAEHGIEVIEEDLQSVSLNGKYNLSDDSIHINERMNKQNKYVTLLHEFAHAIMHKNAKGNPELTKQAIEFEAESVAYMVLRQTGADVSDYSFQYINRYFKQMEDKAVGQSLRRIDAAAGYISSHLSLLEPEALPVSVSPDKETAEPTSEKKRIFHAVRATDFMEEKPNESVS